MMLQWLLPIGFIGLLGLGVLLLIYVIKPSYNRRVISSSYAWQRVIKRKRNLPIDRFRNILLFLCQALILAACTLVFAQPNLMSEEMLDDTVEQIIIIDASASMRTQFAGDQSGVTRFDRALTEARKALDDVVMKGDGLISLILADDEPHFVLDRVNKDGYSNALKTITELTYFEGTADMQAALELTAQRALASATEVVIYSDTEFGDMGSSVRAINLADPTREWNVAVTNCNVLTEDNEFVFAVELGAYGNVTGKKNMTVEIKGVDLGLEELIDIPVLTVPISFDVSDESSGYEQRQTVEVRATDESIGGRSDYIYSSFDRAIITIKDLDDSIADDDVMVVYGGVKDQIKIQYCSSEATVFYYLGFSIMRDGLSAHRDISFKQLDLGARPELSGFDLYIFEHTIPSEVIAYGLPKDGVVLLVDPDNGPDEVGIEVGDTISLNKLTKFTAGTAHPLTEYIDIPRSGATEYRKITAYSSDFTPLMYCNGDPVLLAKNTPTSKVVVLSFSLNMYDFIKWDFATLLYNIINYYFPITVEKYNFEYGETAQLSCKGESLVVANDEASYVLRTFPSKMTFDTLGPFTFTVRSGLERPDEIRKVMVRIPHVESSIFAVSDIRVAIDSGEVYARSVKDLFPYFAIAIIIMLFVEWWLQFRSEA